MTTLLVDIDDSQQACWHYSAKILISVVLYSYFPTRPVQRSLPSTKIDQHQHANSSIAPSIQIRWSLRIFHSVSLRFILKASQNRAETEWLNDNDCLPSSILIFFPDCQKQPRPLRGGNTGNHGASSRSKCTTIVGWDHQGDGGNSVNMCSWDQLHVLCLPCHALLQVDHFWNWRGGNSVENLKWSVFME